MIEGEGALLLSEEGSTLLWSRLYERLARLVNGRRSVQEIADLLAADHPVSHVLFVLMRLEQMQDADAQPAGPLAPLTN
jgi:hypothetical protein